MTRAPSDADWPLASYFNEGTAEARHRLAELELVERAPWRELHRRRSDGSHWRLDAADKYEQRFLVRIDDVATWASFDASALEQALLLQRRGGLSGERCVQQGCSVATLRGSAFCLAHAYERGVRK